MKKSLLAIFLVVLLVTVFLAGSWSGKRESAGNNAPAGHRILYYVDPMNPAHTSDKPGLAPCGMKMEPVYADGPAEQGFDKRASSMPLGTVKISPEKQQIIGVKIGTAEKTIQTHVIRTLGRVAVDENRIYRVVSPTEGWLRELSGGTTGTLVKEDQILSTFYSRDLLSGQQALFFALSTLDRYKAENAPGAQLTAVGQQIRAAEANLLALGMSQTQVNELKRTRQPAREIEIRSPVTGFVLSRNAFPDLRFDRNTELYRIADLSRVWIIADLFQNEMQYFVPGVTAHLTVPGVPGKVFQAQMNDILPQADPVTRTLRVRLETGNPGYVLRPDMFVDVEFPVSLPAALTVPLDAVLDSGLRKTVFVDRGNGFFEPRQVETGWRMDDRVEIVKGLMAGERIVISGTFLIDSESRMKMAAAGMSGPSGKEAAKDPVCGMHVDEAKAASQGLKSEYRGKAFYFCSKECKEAFDKDPRRFAGEKSGDPMPRQAQETTKNYIPIDSDSRTKKATAVIDPVCLMNVAIPTAEKAGLKSGFGGNTYYFCSDHCKEEFDKNPSSFIEKGKSSTPQENPLPPPVGRKRRMN